MYLNLTNKTLSFYFALSSIILAITISVLVLFVPLRKTRSPEDDPDCKSICNTYPRSNNCLYCVSLERDRYVGSSDVNLSTANYESVMSRNEECESDRSRLYNVWGRDRVNKEIKERTSLEPRVENETIQRS